MSTLDLPAPPISADVDLRDFGFMPLDVIRLRDSDLACFSTGDEFKAAVLLWCVAWHQVPAASLPDDDRPLARFTGYGIAEWKRLRQGAMRGWIKCSDGRLYHPVIAQKAVEAWNRRGEWQEKNEDKQTRQQRWRAQLTRLTALLREHGITPPERPTKAALVDMCRLHIPGFVDADVDAHVDVRETASRLGETAKTGTGTGTGTGRRTHTEGARKAATAGNWADDAASESNGTKPRAGTGEPRPQLADDFEQFLDATYPATSHSRNVVDGVHRAQGLVGAGLITEQLLRERLTGFRAFVDTEGYSGPHAVPSLKNWLDRHHPEQYWARDWAAVPTKAEQRLQDNIDSSQEWLRQQEERDRATG